MYWGAQSNEPLTSDAQVVWQNPAVSGDEVGGAWLGRFEYGTDETHDAVRPVATLANRLRYEAFGADRGGYVWTQITLHAVSATLLSALVFATVGSGAAALLCGVLFVVHPLATATVLDLGGISEQLALVFGLASLWLFVRISKRSDPSARGTDLLAFISFALALGSKESAFLLLPVLILFLGAQAPGARSGSAWKVRYIVALLAISAAFLAFRLVSLGALPTSVDVSPAVYPDTGVAVSTRIKIGLASAWKYLQLLIYPSGLTYRYDFLPQMLGASVTWMAVAGGGLVLALLVAPAILMNRRNGVGVLWIGLTGYSLIACLGIVAPVGDFLSERMTYFLIPSVLGLLAYFVSILIHKNNNKYIGPVLCVVSVAVAAPLALGASSRANEYKDQDALIRSAIVEHDSAYAHYDLGNQFLSRGQFPSAADQYELALEKNPELWMAWINLGAALSRQEDYSLAMRAYDRALTGAGDRPEYRVPMGKAHFNRALLLMRQNRNNEAVADLEATLQVFPDHLKAHVNLAFIYRNSENYDEQSLRHFERAIELETTEEAKERLREARQYIYDRREAIEEREEAKRDAGLLPDR
ncbi:MAG: tetratricopeptide repeat protein [Candidatus Eisenbacteria bacterium]|uniref:Tetratricopeptide repeat protein n=1 Tax=Eiseniibacteriota bacterium TaxID=2212470 RepID=A0A956SCV0_UNCEI|nr:tetratricopeptide repeat protein [Candidatus Eisenbacteria bacterium]